MRVLVTGAAGFIGRHVVSELVGLGHEVIALVKGGGRHTAPLPGVFLLQGDIRDPHLIGEIKSYRVDHVMHFAWSYVRSLRDPRHVDDILPLHERFLIDLYRAGVHSMSVSGTCAEYGQRIGELSEEHVISPETPYGRAKNRLRELLEGLSGLKLTWGRFFYVFGQGQDPDSLFGSLSRAISLGEHSFLLREPDSKKDFISVEDAAKIFCALALGGHLGVFNVCTGAPHSVRQIAERVCSNLNASIALQNGSTQYSTEGVDVPFWGSVKKTRAALNKPAKCL